MAPLGDSSDVEMTSNVADSQSIDEGTRRSKRIRKEKRPLSPSDLEEPRKRERKRKADEDGPKKKEIKKEIKQELVPDEEEAEENQESDDEESNRGQGDLDKEKDDPEDDEFNLGMLNLRRVGDTTTSKRTSSVPLNRRGMPQRIRKKNKLFFDDNVVTSPVPKRKNSSLSKKSDVKGTLKSKESDEKQSSNNWPDTSIDARKKIASTLRNLLRLQKAQKWVYYEWFYSNIDRVLFYTNNDFLMCLRENFAPLKTKKMSRIQWSVIRRLMGKPRRCSQKFLEEERRTLEHRRNVIRSIQQRRLRDASLVRDLPDRIPLQLSVGTKVTARLRHPQAGLFTGRVDGWDPRDNTYRITFDRPGLGTHSIPDYEVWADGDVDMVSLSTLHRRYLCQRLTMAANQGPPPLPYPPPLQQHRLSSSQYRTTVGLSHSGSGGISSSASSQQPPVCSSFPRHFFDMLVRVCKMLQEKHHAVKKLKQMNDTAELWTAEHQGSPFAPEWQMEYARLVIRLEQLNLSLSRYLLNVQRICLRVAPNESRAAVVQPSVVRETSIDEAKRIVNEFLSGERSVLQKTVANSNIRDLVTELVALIVQIKTLSESRTHPHELTVLQQSMARIRSLISPTNIISFQQHVEVHVQYIIENTLNQQGPLATLISSGSPVAGIKS